MSFNNAVVMKCCYLLSRCFAVCVSCSCKVS